eukprot:1156018-Pelagomonas_calceolata.AAC.6
MVLLQRMSKALAHQHAAAHLTIAAHASRKTGLSLAQSLAQASRKAGFCHLHTVWHKRHAKQGFVTCTQFGTCVTQSRALPLAAAAALPSCMLPTFFQ